MTRITETDAGARIPFLVRRTPQLVTLAYILSAIASAVEVIRLIGESGPPLAIVGLAVLVLGAVWSWWAPTAGLFSVAIGAVLVGAAGWEPTVEFSVGAFVAFAVAARHPLTWRTPLVIALALYLAEALGDHMPVTPVAFVAGFAAAAAAATGISLRVQKQYWAALANRAADAVATREVEAQRRVAEERLRIARDLHDAIGHQVAVAAMRLGVAEVHLPVGADRSRAALEEVRNALHTVLGETQQVLGALRKDSSDGPLPPVPDLDALDDLLGSYEALGLGIHTQSISVPRDLDPLVSMTAYRVIQEALTNAHRYGAGDATIEVEMRDARLDVVVRNGRPAAPLVRVGGGYGLIGMRERVEAIGGRLSVDQDTALFAIRAELPIRSGVTP